MNDAVLSINSSFGQRAAEQVEGLENKVKASMRAVIKENWMATDDDSLFRAGVGGALLDTKDTPDGEKLLTSIQDLRAINAFFNANAVGLSVDFPTMSEDPAPLMKWWQEVKAESK